MGGLGGHGFPSQYMPPPLPLWFLLRCLSSSTSGSVVSVSSNGRYVLLMSHAFCQDQGSLSLLVELGRRLCKDPRLWKWLHRSQPACPFRLKSLSQSYLLLLSFLQGLASVESSTFSSAGTWSALGLENFVMVGIHFALVNCPPGACIWSHGFTKILVKNIYNFYHPFAN